MVKGMEQRQLKIARILKGYEQKELCDAINTHIGHECVTQNMISKLESGWKRTLPKRAARALCKCLDIDESELTSTGIKIR